MIYTLTSLALLTSAVAGASNLQACPLLGQSYPPPTLLSSEPKFKDAVTALEAGLNKQLKTFPFNETSFSMSMFTTTDNGLLYQYHHTDALLSNSSAGTRKVDADSIYRIGSNSKLLTMYLFLISNGDLHFNDPVSKFIPELLQDAPSWNSLTPNWTEITVGDLASQMGGLGRDFGLEDAAPPDEGALPLPPSIRKLLPQLPANEIPQCGYLATNGTLIYCTEEEYIKGVAGVSPVFGTAYTPAYSNQAFAILGIVLSRITNKAMPDLFQEGLVDALKLTGTSYNVPSTTEHDVIPDNALVSGWNSNLGIASPAGGYFSSLNDMATIGKSILSSTLLSKAQTRRWLKPSAFVESFDQGVGRPWEIFRLKVNGKSVDLYTKSGDWGVYHSIQAILPDYDFGFTVLVAADPGSGAAGEATRAGLPNAVIEAVLPILDAIALDQAVSTFAGTYASANKGSNSSLTIAGDASVGLTVTEWIENGVDLINELFGTLYQNLSFRIVPNQLFDGNQVGFTSFYQSANPPAASDEFFWPCSGWVDVDGENFGNIPLGQFVFEIDAGGKAISVNVRSFRTTLQRQH